MCERLEATAGPWNHPAQQPTKRILIVEDEAVRVEIVGNSCAHSRDTPTAPWRRPEEWEAPPPERCECPARC